MKTSLFSFFLGTLMCLYSSGYTQVPELHTYFREAAENNPGLKASYAEFEAAMQRMAQVNALPDPQLSLGAFILPVETRTGPQLVRVSLSQMFPWFGTLKLRNEAAALKADAAYQRFLDDRNQLFYTLASRYYPLYRQREELTLLEQELQWLRKYKIIVRTQIENDKGTLSDVIRVEMAEDELKTDIEILEKEELPLRVSFNRLLQRPDSQRIDLPDTLPEFTFNYEFDSVHAHPRLKDLELRNQAAAKEIELARLSGRPQIGVGLDYVAVGQRQDMAIPDNGRDILMPMVSLSLPIFRRKYQAAEREAEYRLEAIQSQKAVVTDQLVSRREEVRFELETEMARLNLFRRQISQLDVTIKLISTQYANSGGEFEELLRLEQRRIVYRRKELQSTVGLAIRTAEFNYVVGKEVIDHESNDK